MPNYSKIWFTLILINNLWLCVILRYVEDRRNLNTKDNSDLEPEAYSETAFVRIKKHNIKVGSCPKGMEWYFGRCRLKKRKEDDYFDEIEPQITDPVVSKTGSFNDSDLTDPIILLVKPINRHITVSTTQDNVMEKTSSHQDKSTMEVTTQIIAKADTNDDIQPTTGVTSHIEQTSVPESFINNTGHKRNSTVCNRDNTDNRISLTTCVTILLFILVVVICFTTCVSG